jgi:hypothetical protein
MLISQKIANLLNGISQQPFATRPSAQGDIQENALSHRTLGLRRRPGTTSVARVSSSTTGFSTAFIHEVRRSPTDRYIVVVVGGDLKVYDRITGAAQSVIFPKGKAYLSSTKGFKAFTVGDCTYLVNLDTKVTRAAKKAPAQAFEALIYVRQADYSTTYTVQLDGVAANITTPDASSPTARTEIATDSLASQLLFALASNDAISNNFDLQQFGSTLYVQRKDKKDFNIAAQDGLSDKGLKIVKGSVQTFPDLPARALDGMLIEVTGDPESTADNYWVRYTDASLPGTLGVWVECAAPGTPVALDATTMPWTLTRRGAIAGDLVSAEIDFPTIQYNQSTAWTAGAASNDNGDTFDGDTDVVLTLNDSYVETPLTGADGTYRVLRVVYDVDTSYCDPGTVVIVQMYLDTGSGYTLVNYEDYLDGEIIKNDALTYAGVIPVGSQVKLQVHYGTKQTPTSRYRAVNVTIHRSSHQDGAGVSANYVSSVDVVFQPDSLYPVGTGVTVTVGSTPVTYTTTGDMNGAAVAAAMLSSFSGHTVTSPASGTIRISDGGVPILWTLSTFVAKSPTVAFFPDFPMVPGEHVGHILTSITDGSSGVVTSNTTFSVRVSSMTGGIDNIIGNGHKLTLAGSATDFVFTPGTWSERSAGDLDVCPLPSFVDHSIAEIFFYQNRLGFTADEFIVLSQAGSAGNFMRQTATQLLADDVIDIKSAYPNAGVFEHAKEWNDALYLFSSSGEQFALTGDPVLSPQTVVLAHKSSFPISGGVRPITSGKYLYFARAKSAFTQVLEYFLTMNGKADASDTTDDVPQYLPGAPVALVGDSALEFMAVLTSGDRGSLWAYAYHYDGDQTANYAAPRKTMSSWSRWTFTGATILSLSMLDGVISMLVLRSDGVYLETLDIGNAQSGVANYNDRQGATQVAVTWRYRLSRIFFRDGRSDMPNTNGRLQLRYLSFAYHDTTDFTVTVSPDGRTPTSYTFHAAAASEGEFKVPVMARNTTVTIEVTNATGNGCAFSGVDWEGFYTTRDQLK